jgi:hypothetical protein
VDNNDLANSLTPLLDTCVAPTGPTESPDTTPVPLHASLLDDYVARNAYDDDDDEYIADYIDLVLFAIVSNIERARNFQLNPTALLLLEIRQHSFSIVRAENCLNIHVRRLIQKFKSDIHYESTLSAIEDCVSNLHVPPIYFLADANEDEIAAYIDLIIAAIHANLTRNTTYLLNPSPELQQSIREHSASITTAENCTNVHIRRIIQNFKSDVNYDAIMRIHTPAKLELELTPHDQAIELANDNTAIDKMSHDTTAKDDLEVTPKEREIESANDDTAKDALELTPHEREIESANDETANDELELTPHEREIESANDDTAKDALELTPNEREIESAN